MSPSRCIYPYPTPNKNVAEPCPILQYSKQFKKYKEKQEIRTRTKKANQMPKTKTKTVLGSVP